MDKRRIRSFATVKEICSKNNVTLKVDLEHYHGQTVDVDGKSKSARYLVQCNDCGTEYYSWFKTSEGRMLQCLNCHTGHKDKEISYQVAIQMCKSANVTPLFTKDDWVGKSAEYDVKCNVCGTVIHTRFVSRVKNCSFCSGSKDPRVQYDKVAKIFKQNKMTLLDSEYKPTFINGKRTSYKVRCDICGTEFNSTYIGHATTNCPKCCVRKQRSNRERLIQDWLTNELGVEAYFNYRSSNLKLNGKSVELDLFIPSKNIAFEFNGQAYHNCASGVYRKEKRYHEEKTDLCLRNGIKLYHIWDFVSDELTKSIISTKLGLNKRIYARNCDLREVDSTVAKEFFTTHHVDGFVKASKFYGLFCKSTGRLVCCLSLLNRSIQSRKTSAWEIGRFASEYNTTVVGGYSKLLKYAMEYLKSIGCNKLISYCNRDLSPDYKSTFYTKYGFNYEGNSGLIYWYWVAKAVDYNGKHYNHGDRVSRQALQKSKLLEHYFRIGKELPEPCTEATLAEFLGMYACYNSGNFKYSIDL